MATLKELYEGLFEVKVKPEDVLYRDCINVNTYI